MIRFIALAVVLIALVALPVYAQQSGLTLEGLSSRIEVLFSGQTYLTQRIAALETAVAISSQRQVVALPTMTPVPSSTPSPTLSATLTPFPAQARAVINRRAMIRRGPGNNHAVVATANVGDEFMVSGKNLNRTWWQIEHEGSSAWVSDSYVDTYGIESVQVALTPTPLPSPTVEETSTPVPTATMESVTQELSDRLKEAAQADVENAEGRTLDQEELLDVIVEYFDALTELSEFCGKTRMELIEMVEPYAQRIDHAGVSERTGYWSRWSLLNGMRESETIERGKCGIYLVDFTDWILWKHRGEESQD